MRQVIIQDGDIKINPTKNPNCVVCTLGLEHDTLDNFFENFDKDLKEEMSKGIQRHELILHLLDNYSKTELVLALDNFITGRVKQIEMSKGIKEVLEEGLGDITDILRQAEEEANGDPFRSLFNDLLDEDEEI